MATTISEKIGTQILFLFEQGVKLKKICEILGISSNTVLEWAENAKQRQHSSALQLKCQRDFEYGLRAAEIAKKRNVPLRTCEKWVSEWEGLRKQAAKLIEIPSHKADRPYQPVRGAAGIDRALWR